MKCHDLQLLIPGFIDDNLTEQQLEEFLNHIETCQECYDELEVCYMTTAGLMQLDEDHSGTLDLKKNLRNLIISRQQELITRRRARIGAKYFKSIASICIILVCIFTLYIFFIGDGKIQTIDDFREIAVETIRRYWFGTTATVELDADMDIIAETVDPVERRENFERQHPLIPSYFYFRESKPPGFHYGNIPEKDGYNQ